MDKCIYVPLFSLKDSMHLYKHVNNVFILLSG
jgi:hypothetical protein